VQWYDSSYSYFCHDCNKSYDIIDHARTKYNMMEYLHELAKVEYKTKIFKSLKPITKKTSESGYKYLESRGISRETIDDYRVRADEKFIYFNYATPDNILVKIKRRMIKEKKFFAEDGGEEILFGLHLLRTQKILIICEGEIESLTMHEILLSMNKQNEALAVSVPNGAKSLNKKCVNNCKDYLFQFEHIIIVPHNDTNKAGEKLKINALEYLSDYRLEEIRIPDNINDLNDYFKSPNHNACDIFKYSKKLIPELKAAKTTKHIKIINAKDGYRSGFITYDYNDNGIKEGGLTILTGKRGEGKTTYARQIPISLAKQSISSFIFAGETTSGKEKSKLVRLTAEKDEILKELGIAGNANYTPSMQAIKRYDDNFAKYIYILDKNSIPKTEKIFDFLLPEMRKMAISYNVKVFLLDNLMVICEEPGNRLFTEQKKIILCLKAFAEETGTHVIAIAHPKKGEGEQVISGAAEIENMPDTILRYIRLEDEQKEALIKKYPNMQNIIARASARVKVEKIRDDGNRKISWLVWDCVKGAVYDLSDLAMAKIYQDQGYWTIAL
jgi:twinkle protein